VTLFHCNNWGKMPLCKLQETFSFLKAMENAFKLTIALTTDYRFAEGLQGVVTPCILLKWGESH